MSALPPLYLYSYVFILMSEVDSSSKATTSSSSRENAESESSSAAPEKNPVPLRRNKIKILHMSPNQKDDPHRTPVKGIITGHRRYCALKLCLSLHWDHVSNRLLLANACEQWGNEDWPILGDPGFPWMVQVGLSTLRVLYPTFLKLLVNLQLFDSPPRPPRISSLSFHQGQIANTVWQASSLSSSLSIFPL